MLMQSAAFLGFPNLTHFMDLRHQQSGSGRNVPLSQPFFLSHHHRLLLPTHPGAHMQGQHRPGPGSSGSGSPQPMSAPGSPSPPPSPTRTTTSPATVPPTGKSFTIDAILGLGGAGDVQQRYPSMGAQMGPFDMSVAAAVAASRVVPGHQGRPSMATSPGATRRQPSGEHPGRPAKSKRIRTIFTPEQLERLEAEFDRQQYMVGPERLYLAHALRLTEAQVKVWFQNRRIKWRKQHFEQEQQRLVAAQKHEEQQKQLQQHQPPRLTNDSPVEEAELHSGSDEAGGSSSD